MARLSPRQLAILRAMWASMKARGIAGKEAARTAYRATKGAVAGFEKMRKTTFSGQVFNDVLEQIKKNPTLQQAQAKIASGQGQAQAAIEKTIDVVGDVATKGVQRATKRIVQSASRSPAVALGTMIGGTIVEGSLGAGKALGKGFVGRYMGSDEVIGATRAYGVAQAVTADKMRHASRVIGRYLRGGRWEGGDAAAAAAEQAGVPLDLLASPGKFRKKLTLAKLFGIKPRHLPSKAMPEGVFGPPSPGRGTLSPKAVTEGVAGLPGRSRKFLVEMGLGGQEKIPVINRTINVLYDQLRRLNKPIISARRQLKRGLISEEQFVRIVDRHQPQREKLTREIQDALALRRTGGYDVDRGHYLAVAGGLGYVAQKKAKERYQTWQGGTNERAAKRMQEQLYNVYYKQYRDANPKANNLEVEQAARLKVADTVRQLQFREAMREANQMYEMMQRDPDPTSALRGYGYDTSPQSRRPRESRMSVRARLRRGQR